MQYWIDKGGSLVEFLCNGVWLKRERYLKRNEDVVHSTSLTAFHARALWFDSKLNKKNWLNKK